MILLLGGPPDPERDSDENIISVFINKVVNPDKPFGSTVCASEIFPCGSFLVMYMYHIHTLLSTPRF